MTTEHSNGVAPHADADADTNDRLKLFAAGLNAHDQLDSSNDGRDVRAFTSIIIPDGGQASEGVRDVLFAGWSTTVLISRTGKLRSLGHQTVGDSEKQRLDSHSRPVSAFGDHNGLLGFLDLDGGLACCGTTEAAAEGGAAAFTTLTTEASPSLSHIALAGNERITVTFKQAPNGRLCHVVAFSDIDGFMAWYSDHSAKGNYPERHHMLPGRPKQLLANAATFLLLLEGGEVYSWGDPRHQSLGRTTHGGDATPAEEPGVVEALGGLRISKIASGGWMSAALSEDGALYLWGGSPPGAEKFLSRLREAGAGEVTLVELPGDGNEPPDVIDVAVGDAHVVAVTADHRLFVVGDNKNGQLGLDSAQAFFEDWTEVEALQDVQRVVCGPKASFAFVGAGHGNSAPNPNRPAT
ncbi:hypothetical protein LTR85_007739 [Meristemomyces frigidus]|nr:hypothetical protein LTR85_007739 [Meristemomyces frigidus]